MITDGGGREVEISPATAGDVPALVETQIRAFHDDARRFGLAVGGGEPGGPPGYDYRRGRRR